MDVVKLPRRIPRQSPFRGVAKVPGGPWRSHPLLTMATAVPDIALLRRVAEALREWG